MFQGMIGHCIGPYVLHIMDLAFYIYRWQHLHGNKNECTLLTDMQHSQPHITLFHWYTSLIWVGIILCSLESIMTILFHFYLASIISPSSGGLTMILWSSHTDTCNKLFGTIYFSDWPSIETQRISFTIDECTTWVWWRIQKYRYVYSVDLICVRLTVRNNWPRHMACYDIFDIWFIST